MTGDDIVMARAGEPARAGCPVIRRHPVGLGVRNLGLRFARISMRGGG